MHANTRQYKTLKAQGCKDLQVLRKVEILASRTTIAIENIKKLNENMYSTDRRWQKEKVRLISLQIPYRKKENISNTVLIA